VLPLSVDALTGTVYVLLGKERRVHGWADSETWSDFGGRYDLDADVEHAAAREFWEETCALVSWGGSAPSVRVRYYDARAALVRSANVFDECDSFARALRDGEFVCSCATGSRVTFVKMIPFDAALPHSFDVVWRELHARFYAQVVRPAQKARAAVPLPEYVDAHDVSEFGCTLLVRVLPWSSEVDGNEGAGAGAGGATLHLSDEDLGELLVPEESGSVTVRASYDNSSLSGSLLTRNHPARSGVTTNGAFLEKKALWWVPLDVLQLAVARPDGILRHDANHLERLRPSCLDRLRSLLPRLMSSLS